KGPGSFFFIMLAAVASCMPFDVSAIPTKLGLITLGVLNSVVLAIIYSSLTYKKSASAYHPQLEAEGTLSLHFMEATTMGCFMFGSMLLGRLLHLENPYWVPVSCAAVMQGASTYHIWQRSLHRIVGTFLGVGLCWVILSVANTPLSICVSIITLQFIIEMLVLRNYGLAVIFITPMTILLTEAGRPLIHDPNLLIETRFWDIALGSAIGAVGGWVIHHEKLRHAAPVFPFLDRRKGKG
ncbi:MAG: FUSC family protein, partial [Bdellovibrio sp.]|nr:FUSC family protein [Bdellovibrio sp.]